MEDELFHAISSYMSSPNFILNPKHDYIEFSDNNKTASVSKLAPHCNTIFGPVLNKTYMINNNLKYYCKFTPKSGNIAVAIVPSEWHIFNLHFIKVKNAKISYIYQNGWCRGREELGKGSNQYKQIGSSYFIPSETTAIIEIDLHSLKMSITNAKGHCISVDLYNMENYHLSFEIGNSPGQITVIDQWWKTFEVTEENKSSMTNALPFWLMFHFANR